MNPSIGKVQIPLISEWRRTRKQGAKLNYYRNEVKNLYNDRKLDGNDIERLDKLKDDVTNDYTIGRINKEQVDKLGEEISINYRDF